MALVQTTQRPLGFQAPDFFLTDTISGEAGGIKHWRGERLTVVAFICNHCPYVKHMIEPFVAFTERYLPLGVGFITISANDVEHYPEDAPEHMKALGQSLHFRFPYLYDSEQSVARAYDAACTPDFSVFDAQLNCIYRGRFDDSTPGNGRPVTGADLGKALDAFLYDQTIVKPQFPSMGCSIKWK